MIFSRCRGIAAVFARLKAGLRGSDPLLGTFLRELGWSTFTIFVHIAASTYFPTFFCLKIKHRDSLMTADA